MPKSDALNLIFSVSLIICFCGFGLNDDHTRVSIRQATVQPSLAYTVQSEFSERLQGGVVLRFDFGLIVVNPIAPPGSQPTALTTDAIITSSVRSRIAAQSELAAQHFEIQTDAGVVTIHANGASLEQAAEVINLALGVPDVRQIVYTMPANARKTVEEEGVQELQEFRSCRMESIGISRDAPFCNS
jgi:hypothetical protein